MRYFLFALLLSTPAIAQLVSAGVKAGVPLGDAYAEKLNYSLMSEARRYLVGGTVEVHLPLRFSVELDGIYKRTGFSTSVRSLDLGSYSSRISANQWEFPLLAKYEILGGHVRPFIDAGPVLRHISGITDTETYLTFFPPLSGTTTANNSGYLEHRNSAGIAVGGGVTFKLFHIRISPEVRYMRWGNEIFAISPPHVTSPNQQDILAGFTF